MRQSLYGKTASSKNVLLIKLASLNSRGDVLVLFLQTFSFSTMLNNTHLDSNINLAFGERARLFIIGL